MRFAHTVPAPRRLLLASRLLLLWLVALTLPARAEDLLPVRSAYQVETAVEAGRLLLRFQIAPDYYLYRDKLGFEASTPGVTLGQATLPVGVDHEDEFFGRQVIYRDTALVGIPVTFAGPPRDFEVRAQVFGDHPGCNGASSPCDINGQ